MDDTEQSASNDNEPAGPPTPQETRSLLRSGRKANPKADLVRAIDIVGAILGSVIAALAIFAVLADGHPSELDQTFAELLRSSLVFQIGLAVVVLVLVLTAYYALYSRIRLNRSKTEAYERVATSQEAALNAAGEQVARKMSLESLHDYNRLLLDDYHNIATDQATASFRSSRRAMLGGFIWLLACFSAAVWQVTAPGSQVLLGALAAVGGALSGYLSRTYLRVYERTLVQLNQYYRQPLLNSYLLSAERILRDVNEPDLKAAMYGRLLTQIITSAGALDDLFTTDALGVIGLGDDRRGVRHGRNPDSDSSRDNAAGRASGD